MKKLLCFLTGVLFGISGLYAQNCIHFFEPNLYPERHSNQSIELSFSNVNWDNTQNKYAIHYDFYKRTDPEENFHLMTDLEMDQDFNMSQTTFQALFIDPNYYYGQFAHHSSDYFPNDFFEAGSNMSSIMFNFFYKDYLENGGKIKIDLGWRSDRDYSKSSYKLVIKLVTMLGGNDQQPSIKYNGHTVGGYNASLGSTTVAIDTITTIKYLTETLYDTVCYREAFNGYTVGRLTLVPDTITHYHVEGNNNPYYSEFTQNVIFGSACNERIDSIGTVKFVVRNQLSFDTIKTGSILQVCDAQCTAGKVYIKFDKGVAPYTIQVDKGGSPYRTVISETANNNLLIDSLQVGTYTLTLTDAVGCDSIITGVNIVIMDQPNELTLTLTSSPITCHNGNDGTIISSITSSGGEVEDPTYKWKSTDGTNVSDSIRPSITKLSAGTYSLTVTDKYGCKATKGATLINPDALESKDTIYCCTNELESGVHYTVEGADTIFYAAGTKDALFHSVKGCDSLVKVTLIAYENPTVTISGERAACVNEDFSFETQDNMEDYEWRYKGTTPTNFDPSDQRLTVTWATAGTDTITVNYTKVYTDAAGNTHGCRSVGSDTIIFITVNPLPDKTVTTKVNDADSTLNITACAGQTVTLTAAEGNEYTWMKVGSADNLGSNRTLTLGNITSGEVGQYYAILNNSTTGCTNNSDTVTIAVNTPSVSISDGTPDDICLGNSQTLTAEPTHSNDGTLYYKWSTDETTASITVTPNTIGAKEYTVIVTDSIGKCSAKATATFSFTVKDTVKLTFHDGTDANPSICLGNPIEEILIDSANCSPLTISPAQLPAGLTFANGKISGTPTEATTYAYTISAASDNGCTASNKFITGTITVKDTVKLNVTGDTTQTFCLGASLTGITFGVTNGTGELTWATGQAPEGVTSSNTGISGTPTAAGIYKYTYTAATNNGCSDYNKTITGTITVNDTVKLTVTGDTTFSICPKTAMAIATQFTVTNGTIVKTGDLPEGLTFSTENAINGTPTQVGIFHYTIKANSEKGCSSKTMTGTITVHDTATMTVTGTTEQTFCLGSELSDISFEITNGEYDNIGTLPAGVTFGNNKISGTPTAPGEFTYTVKVKDANNCSDFNKEQIVKITVYDTVKLTVSGDTTQTKCLSNSLSDITFSVVNGIGNLAWSTTPTGVTSDNTGISGTPTAAGIYKYTYTASSEHSCTSKTVTGTITINDTVKLTITGDTTQAFCLGSSLTDITFGVTNGTGELTWANGQVPAGVTSSNTGISGTPAKGTYKYTYTATSNNGCSAYNKTITGTITVNDTVKLTGTADTSFAVCLGAEFSKNLPFTVENANYVITDLPEGISYSDNGFYGTPINATGDFRYTITATSNQDPACSVKSLTGTITVNDTVKLTVDGDTTQAFCLGASLTGITFSVTNGTPSLTWANDQAPAGVTYSTTGISGMPTAAGIYKYTYTASSNNGCSAYNKRITGTITVNDTVQLKFHDVADNGNRTVCQGSTIESITFDSANCTLSITWDNVPAGITFANGTISGTPAGTHATYNYTVTASSNQDPSCSPKTLPGTITVNDTVQLTYTGNLAQTICLGNEIQDVTFTVTNGDAPEISWSGADHTGLSFTSSKINGTPEHYGEITYTVFSKNSNCAPKATDTITGTINVMDTAKVWFGNDKNRQAICLGGSIANIQVDSLNCDHLNVTGLPAGVSYASGIISGTPTATGVFVYTIQTTASNIAGNTHCGSMKISDTITVYELPTVSIVDQNPNGICSGLVDTITANATAGKTPYSYTWTNGISTTEKAAITTTGDYTVTVTDANNCTATDATHVTVFPLPSVAINASTPTAVCKGTEVTIDLSSPAEPAIINYKWIKGEVVVKEGATEDSYTFTANGDSTYMVVVSTENGCTDTAIYTGTVYQLPEITLKKRTNVSCKGNNTGSLDIEVNGTTPYNYSWEGPDNYMAYGNKKISSLYAGEYTVTVTDGHSCTATAEYEITEPATALSATVTIDSVKCFGGNDGSINIVAAGGTPINGSKYQYRLSTEADGVIAATRELSSQYAGEYHIIVSDDNACTVNIDTIIGQPAAAMAFASVTVDSVKCFGENNGKIQINVTGGNGGYTYAWTGPNSYTGNAATIENLYAGEYHVTVTDRKGCSISKDTAVGQPAASLTIEEVADAHTDVDCKGNSTGSVTVKVNGGTAGYQYKVGVNSTYNTLSDATTFTYDNRPAELDTIYVKDANGCEAHIALEITEPEELTINITERTDITCNDDNDGVITVSSNGGTGTHKYSWDNGTTYTVGANSRDDLSEGNYTIIVKDGNNCTASTSATIVNPGKLTITETLKNPTCYGSDNGEISVVVTGGTGARSYFWSNNAGTGTYDTLRTNLVANTDYTLDVYDANQCHATMTKSLTQPENFSVVISGIDSICAGNTTDFTAAVPAPHDSTYTFTWYKVGETTPMTSSTGLSVAGDYAVVATQSTTNCTKSDTVTLTVLDNPVLVFTHDPNDTVCLHTQVTITVSGANNGYSWVGGGSDNVEHANDEVGTQYFEVTGTNTFGTRNCSSTAKDTVVVLPLPSATLTTTVNDAAVTDNYNVELCADGKVVMNAPAVTGCEYAWYKEGNSDPIEDNSTLTLEGTTLITGNYYVVVKNTATGCDSTSEKVKVTVNELPAVVLVEDNSLNTICADSAFHFTANAPTATIFEWVHNNNVLTVTENTYRSEEAGKYVVNVTDAKGCKNTSDTLTVKVNKMPVVTFNEQYNAATICNDSVFHFIVESDTVIASYTWHGGANDGISAEVNATSFTKDENTDAGNFTYTVEIVDKNNCKVTTSEMNVKVNALPDVAISEQYGATTICDDSVFHFTVTSDTVIASYTWHVGQNNGATGTPNATTFNMDENTGAGNYAYTVDIVDKNGCKNTSAAFNAHVDTLPNVTVTDKSVCLNSTVVLTAENATEYTWTPADWFETATGASVTFKNTTTAGERAVTVKGTDGHGCSATSNATVTVNNLPSVAAQITASKERTCLNDTASFSVTIASTSTCAWTSTLAGSLSDPTQSRVTFTGNTANNTTGYDVTVTVTDENGCVASASKNIIVDTLPTVVITANGGVCQNDTIKFTTQTGDGISNWNWTYTTTNAIYHDENENILKVVWSDDDESEKTVTVNYSDGRGCRSNSATDTVKTVKVYDLPVVTITNDPVEIFICKGSSVNLDAESNKTSTTFEWANNVQGSEEATVSPDKDSTFIVTGTYEPATGLACKSSDTIIVRLKDTVTLSADLLTQEICLGTDITGIILDTANCELSFKLNEGTYSNSLTIGHGLSYDATSHSIVGKPDEAMVYTISIKGTNGNSCGEKEVTVTITAKDTNKLSSTTTITSPICLGQPITDIVLDTANCMLAFTLNGNDGLSNSLSYDATSHSITGSPDAAMTYNITVTAAAINAAAGTNCNANKSLSFTIIVNDTNKLTSTSLVEDVFCLGTTMTAIELDTANCTLAFTLNGNDGLSHGLSYDATSHSIIGTPDTAMTYIIKVTANPIYSGCNEPKELTFTRVVNDTVILTATGSLSQEFCLNDHMSEAVKFTAANGTLGIKTGTELTGVTLSSTDSTLYGTPVAAGTHTITVEVVSTACPASYKSIDVTLTVDTIPAVTITAPDSVCPNADLRLTLLTATAGYEKYQWNNGDETTDNIYYVTPEAATNIYSVTVTNALFCTATASDTIRLYTLPGTTIISDPTSAEICLGQSATLTAAADANHTAFTYEWIGINAAAATNNEITVSPVADSIFRVRVVDINSCYDTAEITIKVDTLPVVNLTSNGITSVCEGGNIVFEANNAYTNYAWSLDNNNVTETSNSYTFNTEIGSTAGDHKIAVTITDGNTCSTKDSITVTVNPTPVLSEVHNRVRCFGEENAHIDLTVTNATVSTYSWTKENDASYTSNGEDINGLSAGNYMVLVTSDHDCVAKDTVTIEQPAELTLTFAHKVTQLCSGADSLTVTPVGGNGGFTYIWETDMVNPMTAPDTVQNSADSILHISNLSNGTHYYMATVTDDSNCVAYTTMIDITSERIEKQREINLGPDDTYSYTEGGITYTYTAADDGVTFEESAGQGTGGCDSVVIYTIHAFGIDMHFADNFNVTHSSYFSNYSFTPHRIGDTIITEVGNDEMFYVYMMTDTTVFDNALVDMRYEILFNDNPIQNEDFEESIGNLKISSYYENEDLFYGHSVDSARGEAPATTFYYQIPSNGTAYFFDYFNFRAFNKMPQKIDFRFLQTGTYTIKLYVENRIGGTAHNTEGLYNPYVVNRRFGPFWGGRGDNPTGRELIVARYMTVIVGGAGSSPVISSIDDYAQNAEPSVVTYPNPAHDMIYLNINGMEGNTRITITDVAGKVVANHNENLLNNETTLNYSVATFAQGIYFLNVYNNGTVITKKFVVTK